MKAKVTISRSSDDIVRISFKEEKSGISFAEVKMTPHDFAMALTGLSMIEADLEVKGLQHVGKTRVIECREIYYPFNTHNREKMSAWIRENDGGDGWFVNDYLGSQSSIERKGNGYLLRYSVYKYVNE